MKKITLLFCLGIALFLISGCDQKTGKAALLLGEQGEGVIGKECRNGVIYELSRDISGATEWEAGSACANDCPLPNPSSNCFSPESTKCGWWCSGRWCKETTKISWYWQTLNSRSCNGYMYPTYYGADAKYYFYNPSDGQYYEGSTNLYNYPYYLDFNTQPSCYQNTYDKFSRITTSQTYHSREDMCWLFGSVNEQAYPFQWLGNYRCVDNYLELQYYEHRILYSMANPNGQASDITDWKRIYPIGYVGRENGNNVYKDVNDRKCSADGSYVTAKEYNLLCDAAAGNYRWDSGVYEDYLDCNVGQPIIGEKSRCSEDKSKVQLDHFENIGCEEVTPGSAACKVQNVWVDSEICDPGKICSEDSPGGAQCVLMPCVDDDGDDVDSCSANGEPIPGCSSTCDCNDNDANINPGATEICDGVDNDCNGEIDEEYVCIPITTCKDFCEGLEGVSYTAAYVAGNDDPNKAGCKVSQCSAGEYAASSYTDGGVADDSCKAYTQNSNSVCCCVDKEVCDDGIDNDKDGFIDCADQDCPNCAPCMYQNTNHPELGGDLLPGFCYHFEDNTNGCVVDKDKDEYIYPTGYADDPLHKCLGDCNDIPSIVPSLPDICKQEGVDCTKPEFFICPKCINPGKKEICNDNVDNDCDGLTDCQDVEDCPTCSACKAGSYTGFCQQFSSGNAACVADTDKDGYLAGGTYDPKNPQSSCFGDCDYDPMDDMNDPLCKDKGSSLIDCNKKDNKGYLVNSGCAVCIHPGQNEMACNDKIDNDCDSNTDCGDDECDKAQCTKDPEKYGLCTSTEPVPNGACTKYNTCHEACMATYPSYKALYDVANPPPIYARCTSASSCNYWPWCINENVDDCSDGSQLSSVGLPLGRACDCGFDNVCNEDPLIIDHPVKVCLDQYRYNQLSRTLNLKEGGRGCYNGWKCYGTYSPIGGPCYSIEDKVGNCKYCDWHLKGMDSSPHDQGIWKFDMDDHLPCWTCKQIEGRGLLLGLIGVTSLWPVAQYDQPKACKMSDDQEGTCKDGECIALEAKPCSLDESSIMNSNTRSSKCPSYCSLDRKSKLHFYCSSDGVCKQKPSPYGKTDCYPGWGGGGPFEQMCFDQADGPTCLTTGGLSGFLVGNVRDSVGTFSRTFDSFGATINSILTVPTFLIPVPGASYVVNEIRCVIINNDELVVDPVTGEERRRLTALGCVL